MERDERYAADRAQDRAIEAAAGWPTAHDLVVHLRDALGLFSGAMPVPPQQAWEEALAEARRLRTESAQLRLQLKECGSRHTAYRGAVEEIDRQLAAFLAEKGGGD